MAFTLAELIKRVPAATEERVNACRRRLNPIIREILRKETRLLLKSIGADAEDAGPKEAINVPVRVSPGAPDGVLYEPLEGLDELVLLLGQYRRTLEELTDSTARFTMLLTELSKLPVGAAIVGHRADHLPSLRELVTELLTRVREAKPLAIIMQFDEDILGVYRYRIPRHYHDDSGDDSISSEIHLYWGVIGLVAPFLGVSVEGLTIKVLAHELAHAYTHIGSDIDGHRWSSVAFSQADHALKEGLAQYYCFRVCQRLQEREPQALQAYERLMPHQTAAYRTQLKWIETGATPESIRTAMIEARRQRDGTLGAFEAGVAAAQKRLSR